MSPPSLGEKIPSNQCPGGGSNKLKIYLSHHLGVRFQFVISTPVWRTSREFLKCRRTRTGKKIGDQLVRRPGGARDLTVSQMPSQDASNQSTPDSKQAITTQSELALARHAALMTPARLNSQHHWLRKPKMHARPTFGWLGAHRTRAATHICVITPSHFASDRPMAALRPV